MIPTESPERGAGGEKSNKIDNSIVFFADRDQCFVNDHGEKEDESSLHAKSVIASTSSSRHASRHHNQIHAALAVRHTLLGGMLTMHSRCTH